MNSDYRNVGCTGGSCPKQEHCKRYLEREERSITLRTPPFNRYAGGSMACGYYEHQKEEE